MPESIDQLIDSVLSQCQTHKAKKLESVNLESVKPVASKTTKATK